MHKDGNELYKLHARQILLPPKVLLNFGTTCSKEVVEVHECVNTTVEQWREDSVTTTGEFGTPPECYGGDRVMDDMEGREVGEFLTKNKKDAVKQVSELG